jgi:hypothetical protein
MFDILMVSKLTNRINYGNAIGASFTETSSRTGEGVEELFTKIAKDYIEFQMILEGPKNQNFGILLNLLYIYIFYY